MRLIFSGPAEPRWEPIITKGFILNVCQASSIRCIASTPLLSP